MINISDMDVNIKRAVWSAFSILSILFLLILLSKWIGVAFLVISLVVSGYLGYDLFLKKYLSSKKKDKVTKTK